MSQINMVKNFGKVFTRVKIKYNEHETTAHHGWSHTVQRFSFEASPVMGRMGKQYHAEDA